MKRFLMRWFLTTFLCGVVTVFIGVVALMAVGIFEVLYNLDFTPATIAIIGAITTPIVLGFVLSILWKEDIDLAIEEMSKEEE